MLVRLKYTMLETDEILYVSAIAPEPSATAKGTYELPQYRVKLKGGDVFLINAEEHLILFKCLGKEESLQKRRQKSVNHK